MRKTTRFLSAIFILVTSFFAPLAFIPQGYCESVSDSVNSALAQGYGAFSQEDWISAVFFLRKAVSSPQGASEEAMYMLIKSELYAGEYKQAQADCEYFMERYPESLYSNVVLYQNGHLLHLIGKNENAILCLSDFCHKNPEHQLYASALYWMAESFYEEYNFDSARPLYERVVREFPDDGKAPDAVYKIYMIDQREREEKLLYLLKVTGEENLAAREEYERKLRIYQAEGNRELKEKLLKESQKAESRLTELENEFKNKTQEMHEESSDSGIPASIPDSIEGEGLSSDESADSVGKNKSKRTDKNREIDLELEMLKKKALQLQYLLDNQTEDGE
ncbi:tetratricopeptide repeat protein [Treponema zioleckii]|uniref:tetratricopeptide repeat protein n=1 Tax=Treponema zioleckii TaxID=331680 RepID=UPI00168BCAAF|nr:tetratricopeptide repeat protein [Treponema zioleckii]